MKKTMLALVICSLPFCNIAAASMSAYAADNFSYIGLGFNHSKFSSGVLSPYLDADYNNKESKEMTGIYLDTCANIVGDAFIEGYADSTTRISTSVDSWRAGIGYIPYRSTAFSAPVSCGIVSYHASSEHAPSFTESSAYCKAGIKSLIARHWLVDLNYTYANLDTARYDIDLKNTFQLGSVFALTAGFNYADRAEEELSFRFGVQFLLD